MANKSRDNVHRELEIINKLMEQGLSDTEIIDQLQIGRATFFRYKKKLRTIFEREWKKTDTANTLYSYHKFYNSLEDCERGCRKIIKDPNVSAHDKLDAYKTMCSATQQMAQLEKK